MSITFACDQCKKSYDVDEAHAGKKVKCKACGAVLTVPNASASGKSRSPGASSRPAASAKRPAPVAPAEDLDDPYGFAEAAPAARRETGETLLPRARGGQRPGSESSAPGVPAWVWLVGGGVGLLLIVLVLAVVFRGGGKAVPVAQGGPNAEGVAPIAPEGTETAGAVAAPPTGDEGRFKRDDASAEATAKVWRVKADPAPQKVVFPPIAKLAIPVPEHFGGEPVVYPTTPSPFVIMGGNENDDHYREVWDLRTATRVNRLKGHIEVSRPMALSPDGAYFVVHTNPVPRTTDVWRISDATRIAKIQDDENIPGVIDFVGPGPGRIVIGTSYAKVLQVWDFINGKPLFKVQTPANFEEESVAFSPGRRYMALTLAQKNRLQVYDMTNGWLAGEYEMEKPGSSNLDCKGLAFSPDGTALAGLFEAGSKTHLLCWDATTGKLVSDHTPEGDDPFGKDYDRENQVVQWLPDQSGWLIFQQTIVERASGQIVWSMAFNPIKYQEKGPRKVLDLGRMIAPVLVGDRQVLGLVALPQAKIQTALTLAKGGGSAVDASLPAITAADLSAARKVESPSSPVAWKAVAGQAAPARPAAGKPIPLRAQSGDVLGLLVSGADANQAIVVSSPGARLTNSQGKQSQQARSVDRYDLTSGRPLGKFEVPSVSMPIAISPGASHVLLSHAGGPDRVDVMATDGGKHVAGWRPYDKATGDDRNVLWADFLDTGKVLTVNPAGTLVLWSVPDCKAVYVAEQAMQGVPVLSPDRKALAVLHGDSMRLIDPATGTPLGDATASGHRSAIGLKAAAFDPEGRELAAVLDGTLVRWDLTKGEIAAEFPSPAPKAVSLQYGGGRHVLLDGKVLVDLGQRRASWYYEGGVHQQGGTAPNHRYIAGPIIGPTTLTTIEVPDPRIARAEAAAADTKTKAMLREGSKVSIQVVGGPPRDVEKFRKELVDGLTARFREVGVEVADGQPVKFVVNFKDTATGQNIELRKLGGGPGSTPETRMMAIRKLEWDLSVTDNQGGPVVITKETAGSRGPGLITHLPPGENDWEGYIRTQQWFAAAREVVTHVVPFFVARGPDGGVFLPGMTFLGHPVY